MENLLTLETFAKKKPRRKKGRNHNKNGSVRNINGKIYVDFIYLGERVREKTGLTWNDNNEKLVRKQLDRIMIKIEDGTFKFAEVFSHSKKKKYFSEMEKKVYNRKTLPHEVKIGDYMWKWFELASSTGERTGRTLLSYKSYLKNYIEPFFGKLMFADINAVVLRQYVGWSRKRLYRGKIICKESVYKTLVPLRMICTDAAIEFGWGNTYNPFFGFKIKNRKKDSKYKIMPFSKSEQDRLIEAMPDHWKPYFRFAFCSGLRPSEQISIKPQDIDWEKQTLNICRAMTLDENGKKVMGSTKNESSQRIIFLTPSMLNCLVDQSKIHDRFKCNYFFCTNQGSQIDLANLRRRVWEPALKLAKLVPEVKEDEKPITRQMVQTRHSFATNAINDGEKFSHIAEVMGHVDIQMITKIYYQQIKEAKKVMMGK